MGAFKAALLNEMFKLRKKRKLTAAAILSILAVLVGQVAVTGVNLGFGLRVTGSTEFPLMVLTLMAYTVLPLLATFVAIDMFNGELATNTMKLTLTRPVSRFGIFCAKVLNLALFIVANLWFVMVLSLVAGWLFNPTSFSMAGLFKVFLAYTVTFLPIFVFALGVVLLANVLSGGLAVFFVSVLLFIGFNFISLLFSQFSSFLVTSMFDWYTQWIAQPLNGFKVLRQTLILVGCGLMLFTAGYHLFDRKDI